MQACASGHNHEEGVLLLGVSWVGAISERRRLPKSGGTFCITLWTDLHQQREKNGCPASRRSSGRLCLRLGLWFSLGPDAGLSSRAWPRDTGDSPSGRHRGPI